MRRLAAVALAGWPMHSALRRDCTRVAVHVYVYAPHLMQKVMSWPSTHNAWDCAAGRTRPARTGQEDLRRLRSLRSTLPQKLHCQPSACWTAS